MRLGIYVDGSFRRAPDGTLLSDGESGPFLRFGREVGRQFDELVLFGRSAPEGAAAEHPVPDSQAVRLAELPYYANLARLGAVVRAVGSTARGLWRGLDDVDVVWAFGPHPFALLLALFAIVRRRRVVLGVRQDTMAYFRSRLRSPKQSVLLAPLAVLDALWRLLARFVPVTVVGTALERAYGGPRPGVLSMTVSLVPRASVAAAPRDGEPSEVVELLTVGRVEPEKAPELAVEALARLNHGGDRVWRLTWVGTGKLEAAARTAADERGIGDRLDLAGYVPFGEPLLERYRAADVFVHVAVTEGTPQVIVEALGTATPVVATDVGGVSAALDGGAAGLLVPPGDAAALERAIRATVADPAARRARVERGLELARGRTLEAQAGRVAEWLRGRA